MYVVNNWHCMQILDFHTKPVKQTAQCCPAHIVDSCPQYWTVVLSLNQVLTVLNYFAPCEQHNIVQSCWWFFQCREKFPYYPYQITHSLLTLLIKQLCFFRSRKRTASATQDFIPCTAETPEKIKCDRRSIPYTKYCFLRILAII